MMQRGTLCAFYLIQFSDNAVSQDNDKRLEEIVTKEWQFSVGIECAPK